MRVESRREIFNLALINVNHNHWMINVAIDPLIDQQSINDPDCDHHHSYFP